LRKYYYGFNELNVVYELLLLMFWGIIFFAYLNKKDMTLGGFTLEPKAEALRLFFVTFASILALVILH
jgi:hypothetical protein